MTAPPSVAFHRLGRLRPDYRGWRPLVEILLTLAIGVPLSVVFAAIVVTVAADPWDGVGGLLLVAGTIAVFLPAARLAARATGRPPGALSSVEGRLRWRWLVRCALVAIGVMALQLLLQAASDALGVPLGADELPGWPGLGAFLVPFAAVLIIVPLQAAAEEYVFRGTLLQAIGAWIASPWAAILLTSVAFAAAHGLSAEGFVAVTAFGVVAGWLTVRTGGLEAAIGLHVVNNVVLFTLVAAGGGASTWISELNAELTWTAAVVNAAGLVLYAWIVARLAARARLTAARTAR